MNKKRKGVSPLQKILFPFLIGKVLTLTIEQRRTKKWQQFPFLIGKVLTEYDVTICTNCD